MTIRVRVFAAVVAFASYLGPHSVIAAPTNPTLDMRTPVGIWMLPNQRIQLQIVPCEERLCGKLVWFKNPTDAEGAPLVDSKNPDPALRARPLLGLTVLHDLRQTGEGRWEDGRIYNPDDGKEYQATMSAEDDGSLHVRAYVVLEMLGATQVMTRVEPQHLAAVSQRED